jgi:fused signal recognition particle receptor
VTDTPGKPSRGLFGLFRRTEQGPATPAAETVGAPAQLQQPLSAQQPPVLVESGAAEPAAEPPRKLGWFQRLKAGLTKTSAKLSEDIASIFTKRKLDAATLQDLEDRLIQADLGVETAMRITEALAQGRYNKEISPEEVRAVLAAQIERVLTPVAKPLTLQGGHRPHTILVVGVNGTGKTTTIGKLAERFRQEGKKVTLAAGDTFRAAAIEQLKVWGERTGAEVVARSTGADAAGLAFDALKQAAANGSDVLLIDTAGRLQNKQALMDELEKVIRVLRKIDPAAPHQVVLVLDATTGQNALNQVEVFKDKAGVTGLVMTKLDGTAKGGILVAISAKFGLPVHAVGVGEGVEDLAAFDAGEFARAVALS